jgi:hypothetical protein
MGDELYGRAARVILGELEITGLDVSFRVQRTLKPAEPDTLELNIWNLSAEHRAALQNQKVIGVRLEAGYRTPPHRSATTFGDETTALLADIGAGAETLSLPLIFGGDLRHASSTREGPDWITTISSGDGDAAAKKRVNKSFGKGTPLRFAIEQVAKDLGLGLGQLSKHAALAELFDGGRQFPAGIVLSGNGFTELTRLLKSAGYTWSVQDGEIVVVRGGASYGSAVLLSPTTGLVGSPSPAADHHVQARSLLQPDLLPGRQVRFETEHVTGFYVVDSSVFSGDTAGQDWYVDIEAKAL